jgi:uncharacterized protein
VPSQQPQGYRDAIDWLGGQASVDPDRAGIWGSSYSADQVIMLATEALRIKIAVGRQVPGIAHMAERGVRDNALAERAAATGEHGQGGRRRHVLVCTRDGGLS